MVSWGEETGLCLGLSSSSPLRGQTGEWQGHTAGPACGRGPHGANGEALGATRSLGRGVQNWGPGPERGRAVDWARWPFSETVGPGADGGPRG